MPLVVRVGHLVVTLDLSEQSQFALRRQKARLDGVTGELAHLLIRELEFPLHGFILVQQVRTEHGWIVGVQRHHEASLEVVPDRVALHRAAAARPQVAGDVQLQWNLPLGQHVQQLRIVHRAQGMADTFRTDVDGAPDGGRRHGFSGVSGQVQPCTPRLCIHFAEVLGGSARLVPANADADDAGVCRPQLRRLAKDDRSFLHAEVSHRINNPEDRSAELRLGAQPAALDRLHHRLQRQVRLEAQKDAEADVHLGMPNALLRKPTNHFVRDELVIFRRLQPLGDGLEGHQKAEEVFVHIKPARRFERERMGIVPRGKSRKSLRNDGSLQMEVEFAFRQAAEPLALLFRSSHSSCIVSRAFACVGLPHTMNTVLWRFLLTSALALCLVKASPSQANLPKATLDATGSAAVLILTGEGAGRLHGIGTGVLVSKTGQILTAFHVVKGAIEVQVRLANGEVFDRVELLGTDERRDIAALKISAQTPAFLLPADQLPASGDAVGAVTSANGLGWTATSGIVSAVRPAAEIPGAGQGFQLIQFTAPVEPGASGGPLVSADGKLLGIITSQLSSTSSFAVPVGSVMGLLDSSHPVALGSGSLLQTPAQKQESVPNSSAAIADAKPQQILKNAKTILLHSKTSFLTIDTLQRALLANKQWKELGLVIVEDFRLADLKVEVDRPLFTYVHTFVLTDSRTSIVLGSGKQTAFDGTIASGGLAKDLVKILASARLPNAGKDK